MLFPLPRSVAESRGGRGSERPRPPGRQILEASGDDLHLRPAGLTSTGAGREKDIAGPRSHLPTSVWRLWTLQNLIDSVQRSAIESEDVQTAAAEAPVW